TSCSCKTLAAIKMKIISIISFFILQIPAVFGQSNVFPDTFPKTPGYKSVIVKETCLTCPADKKEKISEKYLFNDKGQNIAWFSICDNEPCGEQRYNYDDEKLVSYTNRSTWVSTSTTGDFGMEWDSTILTNKLEYLYENNKLVKIIWTDGQTDRISLEINYKYNNQGHLQSETIIDYPDPNSVGTFEPNSTELIDDADLKNQVTLKKEYSHTDSIVTIKYFKSDNLTGIETKLKNKKGW